MLLLLFYCWLVAINSIHAYSFLDSCAQYNGTVVVTDDAGLLSDGPGTYSTQTCTWHIQSSSNITIEILLLEIVGSTDETLRLYASVMDDQHLLVDFSAFHDQVALHGQRIETNASDIWI